MRLLAVAALLVTISSSVTTAVAQVVEASLVSVARDTVETGRTLAAIR